MAIRPLGSGRGPRFDSVLTIARYHFDTRLIHSIRTIEHTRSVDRRSIKRWWSQPDTGHTAGSLSRRLVERDRHQHDPRLRQRQHAVVCAECDRKLHGQHTSRQFSRLDGECGDRVGDYGGVGAATGGAGQDHLAGRRVGNGRFRDRHPAIDHGSPLSGDPGSTVGSESGHGRAAPETIDAAVPDLTGIGQNVTAGEE